VVPAADLSNLEKQVVESRARLEQEDLPDNIKTFVLLQLRRIDRALREYPIRGEDAFRAVSDSIAGAWVSQPPEVRTDARAREEVQRVLVCGALSRSGGAASISWQRLLRPPRCWALASVRAQR